MRSRTLQISYTLEDLPRTAVQLWKWGHTHRIWTFSGDLGAGKTTLIRALCRHLGVTDTVSSPTFALVNEYPACDPRVIYHMDWYRLRDEGEAFEAGIAELLATPDALCLIEWPEKAAGLLPEGVLHLEIASPEIAKRQLQAQAT